MVEPNTFLFEVELDRLHTLLRLEPHLSPEDGESPALLSIAVSLKRIADVVDRQPRELRMEAHQIRMLSALRDRYRKGSAVFSATMKAANDFFKDKSP